MPEEIKLLTSRRAYEFGPDDLRLSTLSVKPVQEQIEQLFHFQSSMMGKPMPTFGDVPSAYPPGFVFDMGVWLSPEEQFVPIRFLHFEQKRVVIDMAGPSSAISAVFEELQHFLAELRAADGSPVIGEPQCVLDYSEFTVRFPFSPDAIIAPHLRKLFTAAFREIASRSNKELVLVPILVMQSQPSGQKLVEAAEAGDTYSFTLALRAGTPPEERIYFSGAPLASDAHLSYLTELEAMLSSL